jgi:hypothetical protein
MGKPRPAQERFRQMPKETLTNKYITFSDKKQEKNEKKELKI